MGGDPSSDVMDYVTIASTGDAAEFGDMSGARYFFGWTSSSTRSARVVRSCASSSEVESPKRLPEVESLGLNTRNWRAMFAKEYGESIPIRKYDFSRAYYLYVCARTFPKHACLFP